MSSFKWRAINLSGSIIKGTDQALSQDLLAQQLFEQGLSLLSVKRVSWHSWYKPLLLKHKIEFIYYLGALLQSGVALDKALLFAAEYNSHVGLAQVIKELYMHVQRGVTLSQAMVEYPELFDQLMCSAVRAGDESGSLAASLSLLEKHLMMLNQFFKKTRKALLMPAITFIFFIVICFVIICVVVPNFASAFSNMGQEIPYATGLLLTVYEQCTFMNGLFFIGLFLALVLIGMSVVKKFRIQGYLQNALWRLPLVGEIIKGAIRLQFFSLLTLLMRSGHSLTEALVCAHDCSSWLPYQVIVTDIIHEVSGGKSFPDGCKKHSSFFPSHMQALLAVGYESSALVATVERAVLFQREQLLKQLDAIALVIQPLLMIFLGLLVTGLIMVVYYPLLTGALIIGDS